MLPIIELFDKPVSGAAITWTGSEQPAFIAPFPKLHTIGAFPVDNETVLFVAGQHYGWAGAWLATCHLPSGRTTARLEVATTSNARALMSRDRRSLFLPDDGGLTVVDVGALEVVRRIELYRTDGPRGATTSYDALDGRGIRHRLSFEDRRTPAREAGWQDLGNYKSPHFKEVDADRVLFVNEAAGSFTIKSKHRRSEVAIIDWRCGGAVAEALHDTAHPTALDRLAPGSRLLHVSRHLLGVFLPPLPASGGGSEYQVRADPEEVILWRIGGSGPKPCTIQVRDRHDQDASLRKVYEDPRDGLLWLSFGDACIRSLDHECRLGPLLVLSDARNAGERERRFVHPCPVVTFQGEGNVIAEKGVLMARHIFRAADLTDRPEPVALMPIKTGPLSRRDAKAFASYVRSRRRDRFALLDWSRDSVAAALEAQRAAVAAGLDDLVDDDDRLAFSYKVAGKPVKEAAFFRRIAKDVLPVVPELRALLLAYTDALGAGGEGVQPWQDPDEGVGGLGPALLALALLDPDCLDVLRAYLETRDGEHEGYALDVVVPAFFKRHGWRDAAAVRFGIYATLNRFWGGRQPPEGFDGMCDAMARLLMPGEAAEAVLRDAEHFGRKGDFGYDAAAYRAAFRSLLDDADPYEAEVRDGLREPDPDT